jgi:hypothetical protein
VTLPTKKKHLFYGLFEWRVQLAAIAAPFDLVFAGFLWTRVGAPVYLP